LSLGPSLGSFSGVRFLTSTLLAVAAAGVSGCASRRATPEPAAPSPAATTQARPAPPINTEETPIASDAAAESLLVDLHALDSTMVIDARYATSNNFTGAPIRGYEANRALFRREAAAALVRVSHRLADDGLALKVFDAYRPVRASEAMVEWTERTGRQDLLRDGYIASRSRHNLGLAIDLTLVQRPSHQELDMGTTFDDLSVAAHTANAHGVVAANRAKLKTAMEAQGFVNYEKEWWHFTYQVPDERRFDLVIR